MAHAENEQKGIYCLPNELLYTILENLPTKTILTVSPTSRRMHAVCVRLLHNRLTLAASLLDRVLYLEAYPPSAKLTASGLFCESLGTPDLQAAIESPDDAGKIGRLGAVYSRFRPQRTEPKKRAVRRPGDIPGSRTHPSTDAAESSTQGGKEGEAELVGETVSLDAEELFTQLCAVIHLVRTTRGGVFASVVEVCDGMLRVWRDWLKEQAEARMVPRDTQVEVLHPTKDNRVLWVNKENNAVGIRCNVKERKWRRDNPVLIAREEEVAVSYYVEFEELHVRTSHLLFKLEEALEQEDHSSGRAMIFRGAIV